MSGMIVCCMDSCGRFCSSCDALFHSILKKLAPSPSLVIDIQFNATTAAILCESKEILLYDLRTFELTRRIGTSAAAMALGPRWIAYPGFIPDRGRESMDGSSSSDSEEVVPEALVGSKQYSGSKLESSPYTAIDVAQNVASGLYYLSEIGRATIAPYLSSSPSATTASIASNSATPVGSLGYTSSCSPYGSANDTTLNGKPIPAGKGKRDSSSTSASAYGGWVVVQDIVTERIICNFKCHSTALVTLSFDFSGLLLATCSTKGQNLHVYRLMPPLQVTHGKRSDGRQLLYKLQRGITHASIQDIAFSQDSKWINVTSAHGTSHLYAIHPEGVRINADTHVNVVGVAVHDAAADVPSLREVDDFYADFRTLESKTLSQVLKIRHSMPAAVAPSTSAPPNPSHAQSSPPIARGSYLVESALDASQAFLSHLAQSTNISMDFGYYNTDDSDIEARRKRRRRRISCLFAHDDTKMLICCDRLLKLYDMKVQPASSASNGVGGYVPSSASVSDNSKTRNSNSSSTFGFDASVTELKSWELLNQPRTKTSSFSGEEMSDTVPSQRLIQTKPNGKSELRTFAQRTIPLWAHPKATFRAIDEDSPDGRILEVKRKGPNQENSSNGTLHGDDQMFVLEMDSYFGIGGSPVFNGQPECRVVPEVPPLDLRESINMAMSTSLPSPPHPMRTIPSKAAACMSSSAPPFPDIITNSKKKKKKNGRPSPLEENETSATSALQFTLQDMYFALPKEKLS